MRVGVVGAGAWGTALAKLAAESGHEVAIWAHEPEVVAEVTERHLNSTYLPGVALPPLLASSDPAEVVVGRELLISAVPSHLVRGVWARVMPAVTGDPCVVSATKGIEDGSLLTMLEVLRELAPPSLHGRMACLSGPSFAGEVARRFPTAVVVAARELAVAEAVQAALSTDRFRIYTSGDEVGVEIGGAVKNVVAIAAGIADGLGFGHNTRAALITRGLAEIARLAMARGGNPLTLAGLAGLGDLVLTCTGDLSRNRTVGLRLGKGETIAQIERTMVGVAEGVRSARSTRALATRLGVEMPVTETVYAVLYEGLSAVAAAERLMGRQLRSELDGPRRDGAA
ncbi:MAG: NAD(P)-dependent glycerol-3-phosphate dehydrogenase [Deltaproteobacteria bacterium]|nr:NAD(P)-dependent glycerol-3-phosphate dehydrogenase [Deltaproteobacteria bacterium]